MTTAARSSANLTRATVGVFEIVEDQFIDVANNAHPLAWITGKLNTDFQNGGEDVIWPINGETNDQTDFFTAASDTFASTTEAGPDWARVTYKNMRSTVEQTWLDSMKFKGRGANVDMFEYSLDKARLAMRKLIHDGMRTQQTNGFLGLEEIVFPVVNTQVPNTATRATAFESTANNTYAGIDRSVSDAEAEGFRNLALDMALVTDSSGFERDSAGVESDAMQALKRAYTFLTDGMDKPDLILSSIQPYFDYEGMLGNQIRYAGGAEPADAAFPFENLKFRSATWILVEDVSASGTVGGATVGEEMIYLLNTQYWKWMFEEEAYFSWTPWLTTDQDSNGTLIRRAHNLTRGAFYCTNPGMQGVLYDYTAA